MADEEASEAQDRMKEVSVNLQWRTLWHTVPGEMSLPVKERCRE
jgi:hypothetical protein